jgi:hypothetical protein
MTVPDEEVFAFVDGELPPEAMARIEAAMATDPQLALRVETQRSLRRLLSGPHASVRRAALESPAAAVEDAKPAPRPAEVIAFPGAKAKTAKAKPREPKPPKPAGAKGEGGGLSWIAMAVCLVVGLIAGRLVAPPPATLSGVDDAPPIATGPLAQALTGAATGATGPVRIALTFQDRDGVYCRAYQASGPAPSAGVACREPGAWKVRMVGVAGPAGAGVPTAVMATANAMMAGKPLDAATEAKARTAGWKPQKGAAPR